MNGVKKCPKCGRKTEGFRANVKRRFQMHSTGTKKTGAEPAKRQKRGIRRRCRQLVD